jgi:hypothetical protein
MESLMRSNQLMLVLASMLIAAWLFSSTLDGGGGPWHLSAPAIGAAAGAAPHRLDAVEITGLPPLQPPGACVGREPRSALSRSQSVRPSPATCRGK